MKRAILICSILISSLMYSQIDANSLMALPQLSSSDLTTINNPKLGSLAYDTTKNRVVEYTDQGWTEMLTDKNVYLGSFRITSTGSMDIDDIPFEPSQISFVAHANIENNNISADNNVGNNNNGKDNTFGTANGFARENTNGSITQQTIFIGGNGASINDITRYSSTNNCIGIRYANNNGDFLGLLSARVTSFNSDGFTLNVARSNSLGNESLVVLYTAYK